MKVWTAQNAHQTPALKNIFATLKDFATLKKFDFRFKKPYPKLFVFW